MSPAKTRTYRQNWVSVSKFRTQKCPTPLFFSRRRNNINTYFTGGNVSSLLRSTTYNKKGVKNQKNL
jgi:hypothetical protein